MGEKLRGDLLPKISKWMSVPSGILMALVIIAAYKVTEQPLQVGTRIDVNANIPIKQFDPIFILGNNVGAWGGAAKYEKVRENVEDAGSFFIRYPGGSFSNHYHWNGEGSFDENGIWHPSWTEFRPGFKCRSRFPGTTYDAYEEGLPSHLVDGRLSTVWKSYPSLTTPQWFYLNLRSAHTVDKIVIHWGDPWAIDYQIQYCESGEAPWPHQELTNPWRTIKEVRGNTGGVSVQTFPSVKAKYFRVNMTRSSGQWYEVKEVYLYGEEWQVTINSDNFNSQTIAYASSTTPASKSWWWIPDFGFDEFMQWCGRFSRPVTPVITVNMGTGTPEEAAAWVYYANVEKGYGIKYWEINNEINGNWEMGGPVNAVDYAQRFIEFVDAMKAVDPEIKICAPTGPQPHDPSQVYDNKRYIESFLAYLSEHGKADYVDCLTFHWYAYWNNADNPDGYRIMLAKTEIEDKVIPKLREWIEEYCPEPDNVKLLLSEYGSGRATANVCRLQEALWTVDWIGRFIKDGGDMAMRYDVQGGMWYNRWYDFTMDPVLDQDSWGGLGYIDGIPLSGEYEKYAFQPRSAYWAMYMLANYWSTFDAANFLVSASSDQELLPVYADFRGDKKLALAVVNKDPSNAYEAEIRIDGFVPSEIAEIYTFDSSNYVWHFNDVNSYADPDTPPSHSRTRVGSSFKHTFQPYSITIILMEEAP